MLRGVYLYHPIETACHYHRLFLPAKFATGFGVPLTLGRDVPRLDSDYGAIVLHGLHPDEVLTELVKWKVRDKKFIWSVDDDYSSIPEWNPVKPTKAHMEFYRTAAGLADMVLCSTEPLARTFARPHVHVCPNLLDLTEYNAAPADDGVVRILWQGSKTHTEDVKVCEQAILQVLASRQDVEVFFWGADPPPAVYARHAYDPRLTVLDSVPANKYFPQLRELQPDVVIAPLSPCQFNASKSPLRVLEGWACGAAVVASAFGPYNVIRDGEDGLLASDPDEFAAKLLEVAESGSLRQHLAVAGRQRVEAEFSWQAPRCVEPWNGFFWEAGT